jgi:transcriptional regulator with XRE-family HTH domain
MKNPRKPDESDKAKGRELARRRKAADMTQKHVATRLGISEKQYGKYERGQTRLSATRYDTILQILREHAGGFAESQDAYTAPLWDRDALLLTLLNRMRDELGSCIEIVGRP